MRKVLIANRGEIAVRVAQACQELGLKTVGIFSEADRNALHTRRVDEAYEVGPPEPEASYLNGSRIIEIALKAGADAVHPGYGFLAENPDFAAACAAAGLIFIGPPPEAIRLAGDKVRAKVIARDAGIPTVPGYDGEDQSDGALIDAAERLGFPVMIKAAAGGGGRGMRLVRSRPELPAALASARREALGAFGDPRLFLEKVVSPARHVEVQILADTRGNFVHLFERECSVQRRHQKVIEEAPSPGVGPELRAKLTAAALAFARAVGYVNAGTVEFLVGPDGDFYFLEMNTRLQVEHPVTELVTGLDLVQLQLVVAAGERLPFRQEDISLRGHAIEARIYAEDPTAGFLPAGGELLVFEPPAGAGIRNDVGVEAPMTLSLQYDPMLGKLIVYGPDRDTAVSRLQWALSRYAVLGVANNVGFLLDVARHPEFRAGRTFTDFIDTNLGRYSPPEAPSDEAVAAAAVTALKGLRRENPWQADAWRLPGMPVTVSLGYQGRTIEARVERLGTGGWRVGASGSSLPVTADPSQPARFIVGSGERRRVLWAVRTAAGIEVFDGGHRYVFEVGRRLGPGTGSVSAGVGGFEGLTAPLPGVLVKLAVREGDRVEALQAVAVLEAMKMEHVVHAPRAGTVRRVYFREGDKIPKGAVLLDLE